MSATNLGLIFLMLIPLAGCGAPKKSAGKKTEPSKVEKIGESNLNRITLTPKAEERLGITYAQVSEREVPNEKTFNGLVVIPPGNSAIISAPVTGTIELMEGTTFPTPGNKVTQSAPLFSLKPILPPERFIPTKAERLQIASAQAALISARLLAEGEVARSTAEKDVAEKALTRAQQVLAGGAGSQRSVEEAQGQVTIATKALEVAKDRLGQLTKLEIDPENQKIDSIPLYAPMEGTIQNVTVRPGLMVNAGSPLLEVARLEKLWIRVPLYAGYEELLQPDQPAKVTVLSDRSATSRGENSKEFLATKAQAPPSADPLAVTVDYYYKVDDPEHLLHPQERVAVTLKFNRRQPSGSVAPENSAAPLMTKTVPQAAVLTDINGNNWVYRKTGPQTFERAKIEVMFQFDEWTVIGRGPGVGTEIVVDGAAELFGTEFGAGK